MRLVSRPTHAVEELALRGRSAPSQISDTRGAAVPGGTAAALFLTNGCIVLVPINATGFLVLLRMNGLPILFRQAPVVLRTHRALFTIDTGFLVFQVRGLTRGQLAAPDAVGDPSLLVALALVDVIVVCARRGCLGKHGRRRDAKSGCKNCRENFHGILLFLAAGLSITSLPLAPHRHRKAK